MKLATEQDVIRLIEEDEWMMELLRVVNELNLPDWWISAGFIRSKIWDTLHGFTERTPLPDIDVIYFDTSNLDEQVEKQFEAKLDNILPGVGWSVKNQARMHKINQLPPYQSAVDGIAHFPETVTALGVALNSDNQVVFTAPYGIKDVVSLNVKPSPPFQQDLLEVYQQRVTQKKWSSTWPKLQIHNLKEC
ncbi:nucleotidyltransferase family protein [Anaerobacillus alkaliphilus]|uniref:Nucleotidyltransferase family protein n=1 Tax=Anaerobacillus alkaliphilus TaxID=1548597 RepID=A0A4Q0VWZ0_9BACI|nr:nucleotidyltransferase family protein [Anaerobacillus alkaliphilus]RXJ04257.1 nucleotidyltransferase family protein [Anaerobacillus alkaliphilus]